MEISPVTNPLITGFRGRTQAEAGGMFAKFFAGIVGFFLFIATIWAFVHFLLGGIEWMTSGGDKTKVESAQHHLTSSIIGLIIVFASWSIWVIILQVTGISNGGFSFVLPQFF